MKNRLCYEHKNVHQYYVHVQQQCVIQLSNFEVSVY